MQKNHWYSPLKVHKISSRAKLNLPEHEFVGCYTVTNAESRIFIASMLCVFMIPHHGLPHHIFINVPTACWE